MKNPTSKKIAFYIALAAAIISTAVEMLVIYSPLTIDARLLAISAVLVFTAVYLMANWLLSNFIIQKMCHIYKSIDMQEQSDKTTLKDMNDKDITEDLNRRVEDWANGKTREIDQLKEMENYRSEFLGNVSREMKTPVFNLQGYIQNLIKNGTKDPEANEKYLEKAEKSVGRLINIVDDLDTITKLDSGEITIKFENFDIVQLTREVFKMREMRAQKQGVNLMLKDPPDKPIMVHADRARIREVLANLVTNSINYGTKNGYTSVGFIDMEDKIMVEVSDNGMGIPNEDLPRVFERFYRVDQSRSRNLGGTGLGLAIVKHVIEAHCQTINVRSQEGKGTTFTFTLMKGN